MAKKQVSLKQVGIDKTNSRIVVITAAAAFLVVFFLMASYTMFGQLLYQNRVIGAKKAAVAQLRENIDATESLVESYKAFESGPQNLLGGVPEGEGPKDGSNARLVLDALPSDYDFPALTASLEKLAVTQQVKIVGIGGTDDEIVQAEQESSGTPAPVEMPFELTVSGSYGAIQGMINALDASIRPMQIQTTQITGDQQDLTLKLTAMTYYQPEKALTIEKKVVK